MDGAHIGVTIGVTTLRKNSERLANVRLRRVRLEPQDRQGLTATGWTTGDRPGLTLARTTHEELVGIEYTRFDLAFGAGTRHVKADGRVTQQKELIKLEQVETPQGRAHRILTHPTPLHHVLTEPQLGLRGGGSKVSRLLQHFTQPGPQSGHDPVHQALAHHDFVALALVVNEHQTSGGLGPVEGTQQIAQSRFLESARK